MVSAAAELLLIVPEAVTTPLMKRLLQQDKGMDKVTPLALRLTATVMLGACLTMAVIGEWLIITLFGAAYQPAWLSAARVAARPAGPVLRKHFAPGPDWQGSPRHGVVLMGIGALLNLALNLVLIPAFGIVGAAAAPSIAHLAVTVAILVLCTAGGDAISGKPDHSAQRHHPDVADVATPEGSMKRLALLLGLGLSAGRLRGVDALGRYP